MDHIKGKKIRQRLPRLQGEKDSERRGKRQQASEQAAVLRRSTVIPHMASAGSTERPVHNKRLVPWAL
jgi:hypothetical protein